MERRRVTWAFTAGSRQKKKKKATVLHAHNYVHVPGPWGPDTQTTSMFLLIYLVPSQRASNKHHPCMIELQGRTFFFPPFSILLGLSRVISFTSSLFILTDVFLLFCVLTFLWVPTGGLGLFSVDVNITLVSRSVCSTDLRQFHPRGVSRKPACLS